jgi:hypothetical protein
VTKSSDVVKSADGRWKTLVTAVEMCLWNKLGKAWPK